MNRNELVNIIMEQRPGYKKYEAETALQAVLYAIQTALSYGDPVVLTGFGKFYTVRVPLHTVVNPQTLEMMDVPEHTAAKFRPGAVLKRLVNNGGGNYGGEN